MNVLFSPEFENGFLNEEYFQDLPYFNDFQIDMLLDFVESVEQGLPLKGKNKTSWQDNYQQEIAGSEWYKKDQCWHYHSGPYQTDEPNCYTINLAWNINGLTSSAVLHYQKLTENDIYILAYSPKHIPFPKPVENNPIKNRTT